MSIVIKTNAIKYKNSDGEYQGLNTIAEESIAQQLVNITNAGQVQIDAIQQEGDETIAAIQQKEDEAKEAILNDYTTAANKLVNLKRRASGSNNENTQLLEINYIEEKVGYLYDSHNQVEGWEYLGNTYRKYKVTAGETYYYTGYTPSAAATSFVACAFFDENMNLLDAFGQDNSTIYTDEQVIAPDNAVLAIVNSAKNNEVTPCLKIQISLSEKLNIIDQKIENIQTKQETNFALVNMESIVREAKRNPFAFKNFDNGYVSFVFDDLRDQIDSIASIFEEFDFPLCLAGVPSRLVNMASGLSETRGSFTTNMKISDVCNRVIANGGEMLAHNGPVITADSQYDFDFMWSYFVTTKRQLEAAGYTVRGIIRSGGTGQIDRSPETEKWANAFYEYSDFGYTLNHQIGRITINQSMNNLKAAIDAAASGKQWIRIMGHDYEYGGGNTFTGEADLRELLQYCKDVGIGVVTYAYMFDNFATSQLTSGGDNYMTIIPEPSETVIGSLFDVNSNVYGDNHQDWEYRKYAVSVGEKYKVSGRTPYSGNAYPLVAFFFPDSAFRLALFGADGDTTYTDLEVTVPANATTMVVNCANTSAYPLVVKQMIPMTLDGLNGRVDSLNARVTEATTQTINVQSDVDTLKDSLTEIQNNYVYDKVDPIITKDGKIWQSSTNAEAEYQNADWQYKLYEVTPGDVYKVTGRAAANGSAFPAVMFFASDNNYRLAQYGSGQYEELEDYRVTVPASAIRMAINTSSKSIWGIVARKRETVNVALLLRQVQELQERVDELSSNT